MKLMTQLIVKVPDRPGALAEVCDALADLNIAAAACTGPYRGHAIIFVVVDEPQAAWEALSPFGHVSESDVLVFDVVNRTGIMGQISRACAAAGVNMRQFYASSGPEGVPTTVVVGVDNTEKAKAACARVACLASQGSRHATSKSRGRPVA